MDKLARVICITGWFNKIKDGITLSEKEFVVSHGINEETGQMVILPHVHPSYLGAKLSSSLNEYVLED